MDEYIHLTAGIQLGAAYRLVHVRPGGVMTMWSGNDIAIARENARRLGGEYACPVRDDTLRNEGRVLMNGPGRRALAGVFAVLGLTQPVIKPASINDPQALANVNAARDAITSALERRAKRAAKRAKR